MKKSSLLLGVFMLAAAALALSAAGYAWSMSSGHSILLKRGVIATDAGAPSLDKQGLSLKLASGDETSDLYIVQFDGPVAASWKTDIEAMGVKLYSYLPVNAFQARMPAKLVDVVRTHDHVQYVGPYMNSFKIDPALDSMVPINSGIGSPSPMLSGKYPTVELKVKVFDDQKVGPVVKAIEALGGTATVLSDKDGLNRKFIYAELPADKVYDVALSPQVEWVEKFSYMKLMNYYGKIMSNVTPGVYTPSAPGAFDLDGSGQVIGILDTGLDTGNMATLHDAFSSGTTDGLQKIQGVSSYRPDHDWSDVQGHGSHVAGILAGYDPFNLTYEGVAPGSQIYFQSAQAFADYMISPAIQTVFDDSLRHKAFVHNNSWGVFSAPSAYESTCTEVDTFTWEHQNFLPVFACGNEGMDVAKDPFNNLTSVPSGPDGFVDEYSLSAPSTAKNVIAVGAAENYQDFNFQIDSTVVFTNSTSLWPRDPIYSDNWNDDNMNDGTYGLACFSSRGPTADNRIKPDIIAPGSYATSVLSQVSPPPMANSYVSMGGTSMAAPFVTGSAAIVREYLTKFCGIKSPSAALMKAVLINGAKDITPGQYGYGRIDPESNYIVQQEVYARPDVNQGWGLLDLQNSLFPDSPRYMAYRQSGKFGIPTAGGASYQFYVADTSQPVRVTLVWTDYPGSPAASKALVNDLDLTVYSSGGGIYYGNAMADIDINARAPWLDTPYSYDHVNNVEGVEYWPGSTGPMYVNIQGYNVPKGDNGQPFAVVVSGGLGMFNPDPFSDGFFTMSGIVTNKLTKLPSAGATVTLTGPVRKTVTADGAGSFTATGLIPGTYYVSAEGTGGETSVKVARKRISSSSLTGVKVLVE